MDKVYILIKTEGTSTTLLGAYSTLEKALTASGIDTPIDTIKAAIEATNRYFYIAKAGAGLFIHRLTVN